LLSVRILKSNIIFFSKCFVRVQENASGAGTSGSYDSGSSSEVSQQRGIYEELPRMNEWLVQGGLPPLITKIPLSRRLEYVRKRGHDDGQALAEKYASLLQVETPPEGLDQNINLPVRAKEYVDLLKRIQRDFQTTKNRSQRVALIMQAPTSWSVADTAEFFDCSPWMVRHGRDLLKSGYSCPPISKRSGRPLSLECVQAVEKFYRDDSISLVIGGMANTVRVDGEIKPKRLTLCNLAEAHNLFRLQHEEFKIGRSTFSSLRPTDVVLPGDYASHIQCLCQRCQNIKLMLMGANIGEIRDLVQYCACDTTNEECMTGSCLECKDLKFLPDFLRDTLNQSSKQTITYKCWGVNEKCDYTSVVSTVDEFIAKLLSLFHTDFKLHWFIKEQQQKFLKKLMAEFGKDEVLIQMDFAENYAFIIQEEIGVNYFGRKLCSLHNIIIYKRNLAGAVEHETFCCVSDDRTHDSSFVIASLKTVFDARPGLLRNVRKVHFITDGARQHYKSKNSMWFLAHHQTIFGLSAEWHFHASAHGKGPCDGVGASIKRQCQMYSLRQDGRPQSKPVQSATELVHWAQEHCDKIKVLLIDLERLQKLRNIAAEVKKEAQQISGISNLHRFTVDNSGPTTVICRVTSSSSTVKSMAKICHDAPKSLQLAEKLRLI
jgi:hypothetical protein